MHVCTRYVRKRLPRFTISASREGNMLVTCFRRRVVEITVIEVITIFMVRTLLVKTSTHDTSSVKYIDFLISKQLIVITSYLKYLNRCIICMSKLYWLKV